MKPIVVVLATLLAALCLSACTVTTSAPAPIGGACADDGDCAGSGVCATNYPGGYCTQSCTSSSSACPSGSVCVHFSGESNSACYDSCTSSSDCRSGYLCHSLSNLSYGFCSPKS